MASPRTDDIINIDVSISSAKTTNDGFGSALLFGEDSNDDLGTDEFRKYTTLAAVGSDFATGTEEYKAAAAYFNAAADQPGQAAPEKVYIGRRRDNVAQRENVTISSAVDTKTYTTTINGIPFTFDAVDSDAANIATGVAAAVNVGAEPVTADATAADGTYTLTADVVGDPFTVTAVGEDTAEQEIIQISEVTIDTATSGATYTMYLNDTKITVVADDAVDVNIAAQFELAIEATAEPVTVDDSAADGTFLITADDLSVPFEIRLDSKMSVALDQPNKNAASELGFLRKQVNGSDTGDDWYVVCLTRRTTEEKQLQDILDVAAAVEAYLDGKKLYITSIDQATIPTSATDDIASVLQDAEYERTTIIYSTDEETYPDAAWAGIQLPKVPGSTNWAYQQLNGITIDSLTAAQVSFLDDKNCNYYTHLNGVDQISSSGKTSEGLYLDFRRGIDELSFAMAASGVTLLTNNEKIPFTDPGIAIAKADMEAKLEARVQTGFIVVNSWSVTVPKVADVSAGAKAARSLTGVTFAATLQGAINTIDIVGTLVE